MCIIFRRYGTTHLSSSRAWHYRKHALAWHFSTSPRCCSNGYPFHTGVYILQSYIQL